MKKNFLFIVVFILPILLPRNIYGQNYGLFISEVYESSKYYGNFDAIEIYNNNPDSVYNIKRFRLRIFKYNQTLDSTPVAVRFIDTAYTGNTLLQFQKSWAIFSRAVVESLATSTNWNTATFNTVKNSFTNIDSNYSSVVKGGDNNLALTGTRIFILDYDLTPNQNNWNLKQWQILDVFGKFNQDTSYFGPFFSVTGWADGVGLMTRNANLIRKNIVQTGRDEGTSDFGFIPGNPGTGKLNEQWIANTPNGTLSSHTDYSSLVLPNNTLGVHTANPLPVELISFKAALINGKVNLSWKTATELNNYGYEIQRRTNKKEWEKIGFVRGAGNSNSIKEYSFVDNQNLRGYIEYRLKQIDFDGKFDYSNIASVILNTNKTFELLENYPNPFNPTTTISFTLPETEFVKLSVYNALGQEVAVLAKGVYEAGFHTINLNASNLQSGVYIYKLESSEISISKKMILAK